MGLQIRSLSLAAFLFVCGVPPAFGVNVLMLTNSSGTLTISETTLKSRLESAGFTVNTLWDGDTQANYTAAFANNDCVYVPSSVSSADVANKLRSAPIGVVNELVSLMDELGLCSANGTAISGNSLSISTNGHYITSPFATGFFSIGWSTYTIARAAGTIAPGAIVLATVGGVDSVLAVNQGGALANTVNSNSIALGRRVQMPVECGVVDINTTTANAMTLFQRIIWWATGYEGQLEGYWKLNETSGTSAADSSGNGRTGTVTGTSTWVPAVVNNGFSFNGSTKIQATGLMGSPRNVSIAAWANLTTPDSAGAEVISLGDHIMLRLDEAGTAKAQFYDGSTYVSVSVSRTFAGAGWHHFAAVFDDPHDTFKLYIDGLLAATATTTSSISYAGLGANTVIGRHGNADTTRDFTGVIDDVRVYSYILGATEIAQLHGLVGRWQLNETSGTTAADSTPFGRNATLSGAAAWSSDCGGMGTFNFDGSTRYFTLANTTDFQPTGMLSISAWIKGTAWTPGTTVNAILRKGDFSPNNYALSVADGKVTLQLDDSDGAGVRGNTLLNTGQWYHVAATWDGSTAKIYVNGVLDNSPGTARLGTIATDTRPLYIGGRPGEDYFNGSIRDVRIYNRPLTATEILEGAGLVGHWKFAEGLGTSSSDSSGMGNGTTLSGGANWTSECTGNNNALLTNGAGGIAQTNAPFDPPAAGTVAFWLRSTGKPATTARIIGLGGNWEIRQISDGRVISDLSGDGGSAVATITPLTEMGRWYHFAATYDVSTKAYSIYVDGKQEASGTNSAAMSKQLAAILSFGTRTGSTEYWSGALRDVRAYNRRLCPAEIAELYGLVGYWKLDETTGATAADSSGIGRIGTVVGTASWTTGKYDNAVQLNGATRVEANSLMGTPRNLTLAGWANLTAADTGGAELISIGDYLAIRLNNGSTTCAFFYDGTSWTSAGTSQTFAGTGWHHFAAVFNDDQNYCKLYIDGNEVASISTTVTLPWTGLGAKTIIGAHGNGMTTFDFTGKIDDVRVYNRALCPLEVIRVKNGGTFGGVKIVKWVEIQ